MTIFVDSALRDFADGKLPGIQLGRSLFSGPVREPSDEDNPAVEHCAVFILAGATGGIPAEELGGGSVKRRILRHSVQVTIRSIPIGQPSAFLSGKVLAQAVYDLFERADIPGICDVHALSSGPEFIGTDEGGHFRWVINMTVIVDETQQAVYWGIGDPGGADEAFVLTLAASDSPRSGTALVTNRLRVFSAVAGVGKKVYYVFPSDLATPGAPKFVVNGTEGGFSKTTTTTVGGVSYDIWESDNPNLDSVTVEVT